MLRYFGCNAVEIDCDDEGEKKNREGDSSSLQASSALRRRKLFYSIHVFDSSRLPRIACPLTNNPNSLIVISFPGPPSFGNQSFDFEPDVLLDAVRVEKEGRHLSGALNASNPFLAFVLDSFLISPTIILRVYNHKRGYQKLQLQPSITKFNALVNENKNVQKK